MKKLSLCMIVKNEENNLANCLSNANNYADEVIVVDTGSTDKTKEIASKFTSKIFDFEWVQDFSKARNFAFDQAKNEYLMWLDADDILNESTVQEIIKWKKEGEDCDVIICPYVTCVDENNKPLFQFNRERIVKNDKRFRFKERVHEAITPSGKILVNDKIVIVHNKKNKKYSTRKKSL